MFRKKLLLISFLFISSIFFISCSHLKSSCLEINWYEVGRQDSTRGHERKKVLLERQKTCSIQDESAQVKAYKNGFDAGLREYCSFKTGYIYGLSKTEQKTRACPTSLKNIFVQGYEAGEHMMKIQKLQNNIQGQIRNLEEKIQIYDAKKSAQIN